MVKINAKWAAKPPAEVRPLVPIIHQQIIIEEILEIDNISILSSAVGFLPLGYNGVGQEN